MSIAAMNWAFSLDLQPSSVKFLLVALADNADDEGRAFPSVALLAEKTSQDRKTVIKGLDILEGKGLLKDTGKRVGKTQQVKVYRITPNNPESGTVNTSDNHKKNTENGTVPDVQTVPFFPSNSTVFPANSTVFPSKGSQKRYTESSLNHHEPSRNLGSRAKRSRSAPDDFEVSEAMRAWATLNCPTVDVEAETAKWRDHEYRDPHSDWGKAWRNWMRKSPDFGPRKPKDEKAKLTWRPPADWDDGKENAA